MASFLFLLVIFAHIFTTVYDYIPVVGPFFREKFWLAYLVPGIALLLAVLLLGRAPLKLDLNSLNLDRRPLLPGAIVLLALATIVGLVSISARPAVPSGSPERLKVVTYNILQGYSVDGQDNFDGQL